MIEDKESRFGGGKGTGILIPILILLIALLVIVLKFPSQRESQTIQKEEIYFSFDDFHNMIGGNDQLAASQKKKLFNQYVGKYVSWVGEVVRVEKESTGDFILRLKHLPSTQDYDVSVSFDQSQKQRLENIKSGSIISYTGKLFRFDPPSGYFLLDGEIK
jgi:hypothetical protein